MTLAFTKGKRGKQRLLVSRMNMLSCLRLFLYRRRTPCVFAAALVFCINAITRRHLIGIQSAQDLA